MPDGKVLLIYTNIHVAKVDYYSQGLGSIAAVLKQNGFLVKVVTLFNFNPDGQHLLSTTIKNFQPEIIGFTCVTSQYGFVKEIASFIKQINKNISIVIGGVHASLFPNLLLESKDFDYLFRGEAELTFLDFCNRLYENKNPKETKGVAYVDSKGNLILNEMPSLITNLNSLPEPDRESFKYEDIVKAAKGVATFLFNRGCPYSCTYCSNHAIAKLYGLKSMTPRVKNVDIALKEIINVTNKYKVKFISINDEIFGINKKWLTNFCKDYKKYIKLPFECWLRADMVEHDKIKILKSAGCVRVNMGIESGNDYIRNYLMNRKMSRGQIINAFKICRQYKIMTGAGSIIGLPFETVDMIYETIKLNRLVRPTTSTAGIFFPYPETKLNHLCQELGIIDNQKTLSEDFMERKHNSILKLPVTDDQLNWFVANWQRLVYGYFKAVILNKIKQIWRILKSR